MGKALYRAYRPKKLSEVVGQEHITETLKRALKSGKISHAYLFTGPRGTGKTSVARILAYEANSLPYSEDVQLDIIEIDAASNRRIDEIRDLKERVNIAPTSSKYKVYIIDEVHMLTKEAFNALLKTLEEPPDHAIFILATTEAHKVPETIVSRTQRFSFKPVELNQVVDHLKHIADLEKIAVEDDALELIAAHGEGSFRDSISLLDQVRHSSKHVTLADVQQAIGLAPAELLDQLIDAVAGSDLQQLTTLLTKIRSHGVQAPPLAKQLAGRLRGDLVQGSFRLAPAATMQLLRELLAVPAAHDPSLALELALFAPIMQNAVHTTVSAQAVAPEPAEPTPTLEAAPEPEPMPDVVETPVTVDELSADTWQHILDAIKAKHNTLYGITRMATPSFGDDTLILSFAFPFHQKRLNDGKNRQLLLDIITQVTGQPVTLEVRLDRDAAQLPVEPPVAATSDVDLEAISNIFGNAEIVE